MMSQSKTFQEDLLAGLFLKKSEIATEYRVNSFFKKENSLSYKISEFLKEDLAQWKRHLSMTVAQVSTQFMELILLSVECSAIRYNCISNTLDGCSMSHIFQTDIEGCTLTLEDCIHVEHDERNFSHMYTVVSLSFGSVYMNGKSLTLMDTREEIGGYDATIDLCKDVFLDSIRLAEIAGRLKKSCFNVQSIESIKSMSGFDYKVGFKSLGSLDLQLYLPPRDSNKAVEAEILIYNEEGQAEEVKIIGQENILAFTKVLKFVWRRTL